MLARSIGVFSARAFSVNRSRESFSREFRFRRCSCDGSSLWLVGGRLSWNGWTRMGDRARGISANIFSTRLSSLLSLDRLSPPYSRLEDWRRRGRPDKMARNRERERERERNRNIEKEYR